MSQRSRSRVRTPRLALGLVLASALVGCGGSAQVPGSAPGRTEIVELLRQSVTYDYDLVADPAELAKRSDLTVLGRVTDAIEGRSVDVIGRHITLVVAVERTLANAGDDNVGESVYVEVPAAPYQTVESFREFTPTDRAVFFLDDRTAIPATGASGAPAKSPIFAPVPPGPVFQQGRDFVATHDEVESMPSPWRDHKDFDAFVAAVEG
jgi:hypothetical protein